MNMIITRFIIPFCFGFLFGGAKGSGDISMMIVAIIGILADITLILTGRWNKY